MTTTDTKFRFGKVCKKGVEDTITKYGYGKEQRERKVVINQTKEDHIQEEHHSVEDILPFKATQIDKGEVQGNPIQRNTAAEPSTYSRKPRIQWLPSDDKGWETFDEDTLTGYVHRKFSSLSTIVYAVGQECFGTVKTKEDKL